MYLVTGGAGFIGSNLASSLLARGERVRIFDDFSTGRRENVHDMLDRVELVEGDLRDGEAILAACKGVTHCLHHAALPSVQRSVEDPLACSSVGVMGTLNLLEACRRQGVRRVVFAGSSSIYGDQKTSPKHEGLKPDPLSPYAVSKLAGEEFLKVYHQLYGLETVTLRYFNVFGPRQDPTSQYSAVIPLFVMAMLEGRRPTIFGDGEQSRDFTFVENVLEGNLLACTAEKAPGRVMNLACGASTSLNELVAMLNGILGSSIEPIYAEARAGDVKHSKADVSRAKELLGFEPVVSVEEGIRRTVEWYRNLA